MQTAALEVVGLEELQLSEVVGAWRRRERVHEGDRRKSSNLGKEEESHQKREGCPLGKETRVGAKRDLDFLGGVVELQQSFQGIL
mmetsp:Transcript_49617/g.97785  ORF Transcript_49617/g.97785 Transcript_49617/m.97785 type:complete len:85 (+) Transcript_49617:357-611(+)